MNVPGVCDIQILLATIYKTIVSFYSPEANPALIPTTMASTYHKIPIQTLLLQLVYQHIVLTAIQFTIFVCFCHIYTITIINRKIIKTIYVEMCYTKGNILSG